MNYEMKSKDSEDEPQDEETGPFPIPYTKFTSPTIRDQLKTLRTTLEQFYLISHKIRNP